MTQGKRGSQKLDDVIELEKREALEYFRTDLAELRLRAAIARRAGRARTGRLWPVPAVASVLITLGLLFIVLGPGVGDRGRSISTHWAKGKQPLEAGTVEAALRSFLVPGQDRQMNDPCLVPECRSQSDRTWLIEAALYRSKRNQLRQQELEKLIATSFGAEQPQVPALAPISAEAVRNLGSRIRLSTIERALARTRATVAGS